MAAGAAAVVVACSSSDTTQTDSGPNATDASYGGPPFDSGADTTIGTFYGGPPIDSSVPDASDANAPKDASDGGG